MAFSKFAVSPIRIRKENDLWSASPEYVSVTMPEKCVDSSIDSTELRLNVVVVVRRLAALNSAVQKKKGLNTCDLPCFSLHSLLKCGVWGHSLA
jgi:hypothetical protein